MRIGSDRMTYNHSSNILPSNQVIFYQPDVLNCGMVKLHVKQLLARNLRNAMQAKFGKENQSELSRLTDKKVAPKTISNYLAANKIRDPNDPNLESIPSPSLTLLADLADVLGLEVWELLLPPEKAANEDVLRLDTRLQGKVTTLAKLLAFFSSVDEKDQAYILNAAEAKYRASRGNASGRSVVADN